jgi:hypothetical protein
LLIKHAGLLVQGIFEVAMREIIEQYRSQDKNGCQHAGNQQAKLCSHGAV